MEKPETEKQIFELVDENNRRMELVIDKDTVTVKKEKYHRSIKRTALLGCKIYESFNPEYKNKLALYYIRRKPVKVNLDCFRKSESRQVLCSNYFSTDLAYLKTLKTKLLQLIYQEAPPVNFACEEDMQMYLNEEERKRFRKNEGRYNEFKCSEIAKVPRSFFSRKDEKTNIRFYKKVLIGINPNSGQKKAREMFESVHKIFKSNGIIYEVYETKMRNDFSNYLENMQLDKLKSFDAIFCFSGDGLVHEVINGFAKRKDFDMQQNPITIAHFPSGSGCALSENIARFSNTESDINSVVYAVCHWRTLSLPIFKYKITTHDGSVEEVFGFLSLSLGFFADVDIGSEFLRFMGSARFDVYGAWKFIGMSPIKMRVKWTQVQGRGTGKDHAQIEESTVIAEFDTQPETIKEEKEDYPSNKEEEKEEDPSNKEKEKEDAQEMVQETKEKPEEKIDLGISSKIPITFPNEEPNEPEFRGKLFSLLAFNLPFFSRNYLASPSLLKNLSLINLQMATSKMGRVKFFKYVTGHENHKKEKHPLLIDVLTKKVEVEVLEDAEKRDKGEPLTGHKKNKVEFVIDGETYKYMGFRKIEMEPTGMYFNVII